MGIHVGHLLRYVKFLLELVFEVWFEVFKSMNTCWMLEILLTSPLVFMFGL